MKTIEYIEYWVEGNNCYFQENKEDFWKSINLGFRGFYILHFTDGTSSDYIWK